MNPPEVEVARALADMIDLRDLAIPVEEDDSILAGATIDVTSMSAAGFVIEVNGQAFAISVTRV